MTDSKKSTAHVSIETLNKEDIIMIQREELEIIIGSAIMPFEGDEVPMVKLADVDGDFDVEFEADFNDLEEMVDEMPDPKETIH